MPAPKEKFFARRLYNRLYFNLSRGFWTVVVAWRWRTDRLLFGFHRECWPLYLVVNRRYAIVLGRLPNLRNPSEFNERMAWLKLFDHVEEKIQCSDKLAVREYVREAVGPTYLTAVFAEGKTFEELREGCRDVTCPCVVKTNHTSGAVFFMDAPTIEALNQLQPMIDPSLKTQFGWATGEWPYTFVKPRVFAEELLPRAGVGPPPDYKFHCTAGEVRFLQYIYDRGRGTKEEIVLPNGEVTHMHPDQHTQHTETFVKPPEWDELLAVASKLSRPFKYVRVDLYATPGRVVFDELTFFPLGGRYTTTGQRELGRLLHCDFADRRPAWVASPAQPITALA